MKVLVTGASGYIGRVVVPALRRAGHDVLGYDTDWFGGEGNLRVIGDIRDSLVASGWPNAVVHLAGLSNDPMGDLDPALTWEINYWGTREMLLHHGAAKHVVISSRAVYGQSDEMRDETSTLNPQSTYAECKAKVDRYLAMTPGFEYTVLRLGTVYGHSPNHRLDLVVNRMVFDALRKRHVVATGNAARPLVHVEDVASAIVWAVERPATGDIYNIVGENMRMHELANLVAAFAVVPVHLVTGGADSRDYMASGSKALRAGWAPRCSVEGSLSRLFGQSRGYDDRALSAKVRLARLRFLIGDGTIDPHTLRFTA